MKTAAALLALALASPAMAQTPQAAPAKAPATAPQSGGGSRIVSPPDADDSVVDDVAESFEGLFNSSHDENIRQMVMFRIKQGRCYEARELALAEGKPEVAALVPKMCTPKP